MTERTTTITCPICCDEIMHQEPTTKVSSKMDLLCCNQILCKKCMYNHIISILNEGITGDGRKSIVCPLGCGREISESTIRCSIQVQHYSYFAHVIGRNMCDIAGLYPLVRYLKRTRRCRRGGGIRGLATDLIILQASTTWMMLLIYVLRSITSPIQECIVLMTMIILIPLMVYTKMILLVTYFPQKAASFGCMLILFLDIILYYLPTIPTSTEEKDSGVDYKQILTSTKSERLDLRLYDKWSLTIGLAKITDQIAIHCPSPDCNCIWLASKEFRAEKNRHEYESTHRFLSSWLYYTPKTQNYMNTIAFMDAQEIYYKSNNRTVEDYIPSERGDRRICFCPKCATEFCGLCRRPWSTITLTSGTLLQPPNAKEIIHTKKSCSSYAKLVPSSTNYDYTSVARAIRAKMCPGCSIRVQRIDGCNHMTCSCGMEWCYVCQCPWNVSHYSCVEGSRQITTTSCLIS